MTTTEHLITPPPELIEQWANHSASVHRENGTYKQHEFAIATQAARWGADQELEACCEWLECNYNYPQVNHPLRAARRPKPQSLKEQALKALCDISIASFEQDAANIIRQALEALPDD